MKILFTLISIDTGQIMYLEAAKRLCNEILEQTTHDILLTTNNPEFFSDIISDRISIRNNLRENNILKYGSEFNYNLKYLAFENIPDTYEYIIYLDCDIKLDSWKESSDDFMINTMSNYDFGADRLNCTLIGEVLHLEEKGHTLFQHKIRSYDILERFNRDEDIFNSQLPSEHFFILKNESDKVKKFFEKWEEFNSYLENKQGIGGSWGDGFEIGISARYAGFHSVLPMNPFYWKETLGFQFNGNKK